MSFNSVIAGGCSFTADGIGGTPPTPGSAGGSSFNTKTIVASRPQSWASRIAVNYNVESVVNVAAQSHGNILTANSIVHLLETFAYVPEKTLVLLNISDFYRFDVPCSFDHNDACGYVPWSKDIIPYSYLSRQSNTYHKFAAQCGLEQIKQLSVNSIRMLHAYLTSKRVTFRILCMRDYTKDDPATLLEKMPEFVRLYPGTGMFEYCKANNLLNDTNHPVGQGHQAIADQVLKTL